MLVNFKESFKLISTVPEFPSLEEKIEQEAMIYGGSWKWCLNNAGPLTRIIMEKIETESTLSSETISHALKGYHPVIDTKSVMLMPGMYPCIPGWHCDGVIRDDKYSQPCLDSIREDVYHYVCCLYTEGGEGTHFLCCDNTYDLDPERVWQSLSEQVDQHYCSAKSGEIYRFNRSQIHRGPVATTRHWRYFFRLSFYHMPCANKIRNQVQVYTKDTGW